MTNFGFAKIYHEDEATKAAISSCILTAAEEVEYYGKTFTAGLTGCGYRPESVELIDEIDDLFKGNQGRPNVADYLSGLRRDLIISSHIGYSTDDEKEATEMWLAKLEAAMPEGCKLLSGIEDREYRLRTMRSLIYIYVRKDLDNIIKILSDERNEKRMRHTLV